MSSFDIIGFQEVRSVSGDQSSTYQIEQLRKGLPGYQVLGGYKGHHPHILTIIIIIIVHVCGVM